MAVRARASPSNRNIPVAKEQRTFKSIGCAIGVYARPTAGQWQHMSGERTGQVAVIFTSVRTPDDDSGYGAAAEAMERLAAGQPGYRGFTAARGADGLGIAVSYWADEAAALAWRDDPEHARIRDAGRAKWYQSYELAVTTIIRDYSWQKA